MASSEVRPQPSTVSDHLSGTKDSWHGLVDVSGPFQPEEDRYHLYIGLFCPFAHRVNLVRHLKGLTKILPISVVRPYPKGDEHGWPGWKFPNNEGEYERATPDFLFGSEYLHEVYFKADPQYQGRYSVPLLWDEKTNTIVNNESHEMMRNLSFAFNSRVDNPLMQQLDFYPEPLRGVIDEVCAWMQRDLNTGVYKAGFAKTQEDYDLNVIPVFAALNKLEKLIARNRGPFVLGTRLTEVDLRLYPTVIRFDVVYVQHFKCNLGTIRANYPQIYNWMKGLYWGQSTLPGGNNVWGFGHETTDFKHIKENYTKSHGDINPRGITPMGPYPDVEEGYLSDFSKVPIGGILLADVTEAEANL